MLTKLPQPLRRSANLSIDSNLLADAKELKINLSRAAEAGIAEAIGKEKARRWKEENREAVRDWNEWVEKNGLPLAKISAVLNGSL